jgi:sugar transferase (PEP-CTERM system associated)
MFIFRKSFCRLLRFVAFVEAIVFCCSPYLASNLLSSGHLISRSLNGVPSPEGVLFAAVMMTGLESMGLYNLRQRARLDGIIARVLISAWGSSWILFILLPSTPTRGIGAASWAATALIASCASGLMRTWMQKLGDGRYFKRRLLVLGSGTRARSMLQLRRRSDQRRLVIVGFVDVDRRELIDPHDQRSPSDEPLLNLCRRLRVDEIVVAMSERRKAFPARDLLGCRMRGVAVTDLSCFLERETGKIRLDNLNPSLMIFGDGFNRSAMRRLNERAFDLVCSVLLLAATWPVMLLTMWAIKMEDGIRAPVFYRQSRVGLEGRPFDLAKFRSMRIDAEGDGQPRWASANDPRMTRVGAVLRKTRLDELPQIFNVLVGEMRFVGPRPERPKFVTQLSELIPYYRQRHLLKPGITGWAQVCYRYGSSTQDALEKLQYDLFYIKNQSILFDVFILLQTVEVLLFGPPTPRQLKARRGVERESLGRADSSLSLASSGGLADPVLQSIPLALNQNEVDIASLRGELTEIQRNIKELRELVTTVPEAEAEFARSEIVIADSAQWIRWPPSDDSSACRTYPSSAVSPFR